MRRRVRNLGKTSIKDCNVNRYSLVNLWCCNVDTSALMKRGKCFRFNKNVIIIATCESIQKPFPDDSATHDSEINSSSLVTLEKDIY